jgi:hypothetical protein
VTSLEKDLTAYFLKARSAQTLLNAESSESYNVEWFVRQRLGLAVLVFPKDESQLISSMLATLVGILPLVAQAAAASMDCPDDKLLSFSIQPSSTSIQKDFISLLCFTSST